VSGKSDTPDFDKTVTAKESTHVNEWRKLVIKRVAIALLACTITQGAHAADQRRKVILDDDGFSLAQWLAIKSPDVDVLGVTTVSGDAWQKEATAYALRGVEIAGRPDIPVMSGATYPLLNSEKITERWEALYGKLTWKGVWMKHWVEPTMQGLPPYHGPDVVPDLVWGNPSHAASSERAADFMIRMVHAYPGQVTIIETGPMINLALAQKLDPEFAGLAKELVYMGGSLNPRQTRPDKVASEFAREFVNSPRREFNIRFDPEAASIALRAPWRHVVMVPVDPSTDTEMSTDLVHTLGAGSTPVAQAMRSRAGGFPLWDEIAVAVWLDPTLITKSTNLFVDVNSQLGASYGDIVSWSPGYEPGLGENKNEIVEKVDVPRLEAMLKRIVDLPQPPSTGRPIPAVK